MTQYAIFMYTGEMVEECAPEYKEHSSEMSEAGTMVAAFQLKTPEWGKSIKADLVARDLEAKEVICGFYVIEASDMDVALENARQNPLLKDGGRLEIRPVEDSTIPSQ